MTGWSDLRRELAAWGADDRKATLWWRDDDAVEPTAALDRMMVLARGAGVPLTLAVVPERNRLTAADLDLQLTPVQHGYAHRNHAGTGAKKCELGNERRADHVIGELMTGRDVLEKAFGPRFAPVLVPPWNRLAPHLRIMLPELGYTGLSQFGPRNHAAIGSMRIVNTHADIVDWKGSRGFVGDDLALEQLIRHLQARRTGAADADEATGLLTHHLVHDAGCWGFLEKLFGEVSESGNAEWRDAGGLF